MPIARELDANIEASGAEERAQLHQAITRHKFEALKAKYEEMASNLNTLLTHMSAFDRLHKSYKMVCFKEFKV